MHRLVVFGLAIAFAGGFVGAQTPVELKVGDMAMDPKQPRRFE